MQIDAGNDEHSHTEHDTGHSCCDESTLKLMVWL